MCLGLVDWSLHVQHSGEYTVLHCTIDDKYFTFSQSSQAHNGPVTDMTYSPGCVVSLGEDEKLCVWERHQGHLLNCVDTAGDCLTGLVMLTHNILVTASGKENTLCELLR